jgi:hypothetical protein
MIAYLSDELGTFEVFVSAWDGNRPNGQPIAVSSGGGGAPMWARSGTRVYYLSPQNKVMAVTVQQQPRLTATTPELTWDLDQLRLAPSGSGFPLLDTLPGGAIIGIRKGDSEDDVTRFEVVQNFDQELKARLR